MNLYVQDYWVKKLQDMFVETKLSRLFRFDEELTDDGCVTLNIPIELQNKLDRLTSGNSAQIFVLMLAGLKVVLYRLGYSHELMASLNHANPNGLTFYTSTVEKNALFKDVIHSVKAELIESNPYLDVEWNELSDVLSGFGSNKIDMLTHLGFGFNEFQKDSPTLRSKFDLFFFASVSELKVTYHTKRYNKPIVEMLAQTFLHVFNQLLDDVTQKITLPNLTTKNERHKMHHQFNSSEYPKTTQTVVGNFESYAYKYPEKMCCVFKETLYSYKEINQTANQMAHHLSSFSGIGTNDVVAILTEKSELMIISMLAILKCGATYLPMATNLPKDRISVILEESQAKHVLVHSSYKNLIETSFTTECMDQLLLGHLPVENLNRNLLPDQGAYILFTSGTTGRPKGVRITHQNLMYRLLSEVSLYQLGSDICTLQSTNYAFDVSLLEIFLPLVLGGSIVLPEENYLLDGKYLSDLVTAHQVTDIQGAPGFIHFIADAFAEHSSTDQLNVKRFCIGGESLHQTLVGHLQHVLPQASINNHYGPTETTIDALVYKDVKVFKQNIIGTPINYTQVYILNDDLEVLPLGVKGTIYIGGPCVSSGYVNREDLTAQVFIDADINGCRQRLYNTGDIGAWHVDGRVEYFGRVDEQVKIRGFRIELQDIEQQLYRLNSVNEAVVIIENQNENNRLIAFLLSNQKLDLDYLRTQLLNLIPDYMVPSMLVQVDFFPYTVNGKVDRKALLKMASKYGETAEIVLPQTETEKNIYRIWAHILQTDSIGVTTNFFEHGGNSLSATRVVSAIYKQLNVSVPLKQFFLNPTIRTLASVIEKAETQLFEPIPRVKNTTHYPLSNAQKRLWISEQLYSEESVYAIPMVLNIEGVINLDKFKKSIDQVITRHESLRTSFVTVDGEPVQKIHPFVGSLTPLKVYHIADELEIQRLIEKNLRSPFNLTHEPLLRLSLIQISDTRYIFSCVMHHIISDGWSMEVFIRDLILFYHENTESIEELPLQYKDYAAWQNEKLSGEPLQKLAGFWQNELNGFSQFEFKPDFKRKGHRTFNGSSTTLTLSKAFSEAVFNLFTDAQASLFNFSQAVYTLLLRFYSGSSDIVIGSPIANREHADLEDQIGFYVNMLPLRARVSENQTFTEFLKELHQKNLHVFEHQTYPFDMIVEGLNKTTEQNRHPIFDIAMVVQNIQEQSPNALSELLISEYDLGKMPAKFDLLLGVSMSPDNCLELTFEFNTDLYKESTILLFKERMELMIRQVIDNPHIRISDLSYALDFFSEEEDELFDFDFELEEEGK